MIAPSLSHVPEKAAVATDLHLKSTALCDVQREVAAAREHSRARCVPGAAGGDEPGIGSSRPD